MISETVTPFNERNFLPNTKISKPKFQKIKGKSTCLSFVPFLGKISRHKSYSWKILVGKKLDLEKFCLVTA